MLTTSEAFNCAEVLRYSEPRTVFSKTIEMRKAGLAEPRAGRPAAYTYCPYEEDWVDRMTEATRRQLQQPRFSPIGARRLLKSQKWTDS